VDLKSAHYALGKKCYELQLHQDSFGPQFQKIREIEAAIKEKETGTAPNENASKAESCKNALRNATGKTQAILLRRKLKRVFRQLGHSIAAKHTVNENLQPLTATVKLVQEHIDLTANLLKANRKGADKRDSFHSNLSYNAILSATSIVLVVIFLGVVLIKKRHAAHVDMAHVKPSNVDAAPTIVKAPLAPDSKGISYSQKDSPRSNKRPENFSSDAVIKILNARGYGLIRCHFNGTPSQTSFILPTAASRRPRSSDTPRPLKASVSTKPAICGHRSAIRCRSTEKAC
jgi:hypothetical protein